MEQHDLFGVSAQTTGMTLKVGRLWLGGGGGTSLSILPLWSKRPKHDGYFEARIPSDEEEVICDLLCASFKGWSSTDPGYQIPRRCRDVLADYEQYHKEKSSQ